MKVRNVLSALFCILTSLTFGQSFMNEWIDHSKTYYRFKVGSKGINRISKEQLTSLGIGEADAAHFQLWRRGEEIPIHTSAETGSLPADGFIEFWGDINDGYWEKRLYLRPEYQINPEYSLFSDTSVYFLTVNKQGNNKRLRSTDNDMNSTLSPEPYFMHRATISFKNFYNDGFAAVVGTNVFSSSYDNGEGYISAGFGPGAVFSQTLSNLFLDNKGPDVNFKYTAQGRRLNVRNISVSVNNTLIETREMNYFNSINDSLYIKIPNALIASGSAKIDFRNLSPESSDRMALGMVELIYPRIFNFGGQTSFEFQLPANADGNKLVIKNFNAEGVLPVLYDLTNGYRLMAQIDVSGDLVVVLPPSAVNRKLVLASLATARVNNVVEFQTRNFVNYSLSSNQGNYLIISNPLIYFDGGVNQVEAYAQYRSGIAGGSYKPVIADINQLIDQFGWGIKNNPLSIKNFLRFARTNFPDKDQYCLLIGKGVSPNLIRNRVNFNIEGRRDVQVLNLVPTFGTPSSDNILAAEEGDVVPKTHIGRINVVNAKEIRDYLDKLKLYDQSQSQQSCLIDDHKWRRELMHIGGANDFLGEQIMYYLDRYKAVAEDSLLGANVNTLQKTSLTNIQVLAGETVSRLFTNGFSLLTYFGHSSPNTLEFNLDNPENYPYSGKFPVFLVNGCTAGNLFTLDSLRLNGNYVLSEKYIVSTPLRGGIAFIASTHLGIVNYLNLYTEEFYNQISNISYGKSLGVTISNLSDTLIKRYTINDFFVRQHVEQVTLHGDPAIVMYHYEKPDYAIEVKDVKLSSDFISTTETNYRAKFKIHNIGRVTGDSVFVRIERLKPDASRDTLFNQHIAYIPNVDSVELIIRLDNEDISKTKGLNKLIITIDADNKIEEGCENNNTVTKEYFIYEDDLRPVFPYNYSIINKNNIKFYASTADPMIEARDYYFEIDTTKKFNTPLLRKTTNSRAGLIEFDPAGNLVMKENTVYYWRVGFKNTTTQDISWNYHSFLYRPDLNTGYNQSHYFQFVNNIFKDIRIDSISRRFEFNDINRKLKIKTGLHPHHASDRNNVFMDLDMVDFWRCQFNTFTIYVFDQRNLAPWVNVSEGSAGKYGSIFPCDQPRRFFEYPMGNASDRNNARLLLENTVPDSAYVLIINQGTDRGSFTAANSSFISQWMADTATYGAGNSIYHTFIKNGLTQIDSFTRNLPFAFFYKKGDPNYVRQFIGDDPTDLIDVVVNLPSRYTNGDLETPWLGPMKKWEKFYWDGSFNDGKSKTDSVFFQLIGKRKDGTEQAFSEDFLDKETNISYIDAGEFPYLKMKMHVVDSTNLTPFNLDNWRLTGEHIPEGAIAPNVNFICKDTVERGEDLLFSVAFKNISSSAFDSLRLSLQIVTADNGIMFIPLQRKKPLISGDTILISYIINTINLSGLNRIRLIVNPENDQPELYSFNNLLFRNFYVKSDNVQSWLDVTFDGIHILNRDIVSSRPQIAIKIKDENKSIPIAEQDDIKVKIKYPKADTAISYRLGSDSARLTVSDINAGLNELLINLTPKLVQDGEYELTVQPTRGENPIFANYKIAFNVLNTPMISNMFNYPNPFTSSTAFVFTLTGSQIPQNLRIQILTISGKVVKEITRQELGTLRIGRNITEYKWDGTDQYGNQLANGVYLYRVITNLNGKQLDKYVDPNNNTDKFFTNGYGKMYLMR